MKTETLISLGVFYDDECTIKLDKQEMSVQNNGQHTVKVTRNKQMGMWEVPLDTQQLEIVSNNIMVQTTKPELSQYLHAALLSPTEASLLKPTKQDFLKTWPGLTENRINNHLEKPINKTMVHLHIRRKGLQSTINKPPYKHLDDKIKTNFSFCTTVDPSSTNEGKIYSNICGRFPIVSRRGNK